MSCDEQDPCVTALVEVREMLQAQNAALGLLLAKAYGIPSPGPSRALFEKLGMTAQTVLPASAVVVGS